MARRPLADMAKVLTHYGIPFAHRREQMVQCPLQAGDKNPSMSVNLDKHVYNCFACGAGGSAFGLILEMEEGDFDRALKVATGAGLLREGVDGGYEPVQRESVAGVRLSRGAWNRGGRTKYVPPWLRE